LWWILFREIQFLKVVLWTYELVNLFYIYHDIQVAYGCYGYWGKEICCTVSKRSVVWRYTVVTHMQSKFCV
jgi:hypothetical protein